LPDFLKGLGAARIGAMAGVAAALTGFFLYVFGAITEPPKAILFSGLEGREATAVAQKLDAMNVPYEARGDGGTLLVPADQVTKLRMELAAEGLPAAGVGYEIFDKSDSFGTTSFVQNLNRIRALEGELSRSIRSLAGIESARVHLVIPERQVFARDNQPPSASVVLKTRTRLTRGQVNAVQHLVAAAVAGMSAGAVAIVDDSGLLLAGGASSGSDADVAAGQEERTSTFEDRMRQRVESIVASIVGPGHVRVQVAADMDFNRVTESSETFDPESRVVRSSQTVEQNSNEKATAQNQAVSVGNQLPAATPPTTPAEPETSSSNTRTEETLNYEISKTTKTQILEAGTVKKLSVAVVVDGNYAQGANGQRAYTPRSAEDMTKITELVRSAIGFNEQRGDKVEVTNMRFAEIDLGPEEPVAEPLMGLDSANRLKLAQILILSITALLVGLLIVKPMLRRLLTPLGPSGMPVAIAAPHAAVLSGPESGQQQQSHSQSGGGSSGSASAPSSAPPKRENMIDINQIEGQVKESSIRKVGEVVSSHPEEAMAILRTWLHQPA
jgi:flagellar M-ring protein FliF